MTDPKPLSPSEAHGLRYAQELEGHLSWLDSFTSAALAVLAVASGIYTYLGVSSLLDDSGALSFFAAMSYSVAVSVGIFVFWSYMMRLLPAVRTAAARTGLFVSMGLGCCAIVAMSSWLNAAALAGAAAVEQHLANTVQQYQTSLERAHSVAISAQALERDVARVRQSFQDLSEQEASGQLSGLAGRGAVFRVLRQKSEELAALEQQIQAQGPLVEQAFAEGNAILSRMRALTVEPGPVEQRSVSFSEEAVRLAGVITTLRQLSVAPLVVRSADDLAASVVLPEVEEIRDEQSTTIASVLNVLSQRAETLKLAAEAVLALPAPADITYTPVSTADAVILYAGNFIPSWAGAISIDLLPAVLVFILMVTQAAIRQGRGRAGVEDTLTLAEFRAALGAVREVELALDRTSRAEPTPKAQPEETPAEAPDPKVQRFKAAGDE
ncbi:hypothetical protein [Psychromarinibacter sp. S121]|uniref:hypothetical protein n=1 Tax=Psychromarinibacter sp. S121 TaxID=3415127 RepID=UPI003C7B871A